MLKYSVVLPLGSMFQLYILYTTQYLTNYDLEYSQFLRGHSPKMVFDPV